MVNALDGTMSYSGEDVWANLGVGGQGLAAFTTCEHQFSDIAAISMLWVVKVIVRYRRVRVQCLDQGSMQLVAILAALDRASLAHIVKVIPQRLIGDKQPEQLRVTALGKDAK